LTLYASFLSWRGTLFQKRWLLRLFVIAVAGPVIANQAGWAAAELGRQPWIVWGLLKTSDAVSKSVPAAHVLTSIVMFGVIYLLLLVAWLFLMDHKIKTGPEDPAQLAAEARQRGWLAAAALRSDPDSPAG
jgi:cytochrome bd ubiquinol oxidase subunit I